MTVNKFITATYYGPTNHEGARIVLNYKNYNIDFHRVTISYDYQTGNIYTQVYQYLLFRNIKPIGAISEGNKYTFIID